MLTKNIRIKYRVLESLEWIIKIKKTILGTLKDTYIITVDDCLYQSKEGKIEHGENKEK